MIWLADLAGRLHGRGLVQTGFIPTIRQAAVSECSIAESLIEVDYFSKVGQRSVACLQVVGVDRWQTRLLTQRRTGRQGLQFRLGNPQKLAHLFTQSARYTEWN